MNVLNRLRFSEELELEQLLGNLLRSGVVLAAGVVMIGGAFYLARHGGTSPEYEMFHGEPAALRGVIAVVRGVVTGHPRAVIQFGLLLLMATPVARVAFSVFAFAVQRDRTYVVVTLIVLVVLTYSMSGGYL
jgi:uncharacterized membrane protein